MTASDISMHYVLIILILIFIQGHTDLNHENNKCSETVKAISIEFAVKIDRQYAHCQSDVIDLHSRSQLRLKRETYLAVLYNSHISDNI